jgi:alpha-L-fucosidase
MITRRAFLASSAATLAVAADVPAPYGAVPSERQLKWHQMETYAFLHFTVNTFTDREWGYGDESPAIFNPTAFDATSMVSALKAGGMKGVILTCKHHDGFCLWPTQTTEHSVRKSPWKDGKGDVVKEISEAARRQGLKFGVYLSPWDRNTAVYARPEYLDLYRRQLRELLTKYGPIYEVWHDGANGGDGFYGGAREKRTIDKRTYYDWPNTWNLVRELQPDAVIFSDVGPDIRWVGNEKGFAAETSWATCDPVDKDGNPAVPGQVREADLPVGQRNARRWLPAECDVSIRPGWFWHEKENEKVKTPRQLLDLYYKSVGRGASFLLNIPPDRRGLLHENDVASLRTFGRAVSGTFARNLAKGARLKASNLRRSGFEPQRMIDGKGYFAAADSVTTPEVTLEFANPVKFDVIRLREHIQLGQRIDAFAVDAFDGDWKPVAEATSVGNCRIIRTAGPVSTSKVRLRITKAAAAPAISHFGLYQEQLGA